MAVKAMYEFVIDIFDVIHAQIPSLFYLQE